MAVPTHHDGLSKLPSMVSHKSQSCSQSLLDPKLEARSLLCLLEGLGPVPSSLEGHATRHAATCGLKCRRSPRPSAPRAVAPAGARAGH